MVLPLILGILATSIVGVIVGEFVKRPIESATEGFLLTENIPARTGLRLYVEGTMTREKFIDVMRLQNIKEDHQAEMLKFADKQIQDQQNAIYARTQNELAKHLEKIGDELVDVQVDEAEKEIKDLESEGDRLKRELLKTELDEFTEMAKLDEDKIEAEIRILEKQIPQAKPEKEPKIVPPAPITFTEFRSLLDDEIVAAAGAFVEQSVTPTIDQILTAVTNVVKEAGLLTEEQFKYAQDKKYFDRMRALIPDTIARAS